MASPEYASTTSPTTLLGESGFFEAGLVVERNAGAVAGADVADALANLAAEEKEVSDAVARATRAISPDLILLAIAGTELQRSGVQAGLRTVAEGYADRSYDQRGQLVARSQKGAVIHDPEQAAARCVEMAMGKGLPRIDGGYVPVEVESLCVHGDTPGAVQIARRCREALESAGFEIVSFSH